MNVLLHPEIMASKPASSDETGLLASSGQFSLGLEVLQHQRDAKQIEEEK